METIGCKAGTKTALFWPRAGVTAQIGFTSLLALLWRDLDRRGLCASAPAASGREDHHAKAGGFEREDVRDPHVGG